MCEIQETLKKKVRKYASLEIFENQLLTLAHPWVKVKFFLYGAPYMTL